MLGLAIALSFLNPITDRIRYDIGTGVVTIIMLPLLYLVLRKVFSFLKRLLTYILDWLTWSASRTLFHSLASRISLRRYCAEQLTHARTRYLRVPGTVDVALETDSVYVSMVLEPSVGEAVRENRLVRVANRMRILGDPGSGKSSIVKRLFRNACHGAMRKPANSRLPILIDLKTFQPVPDAANDDVLAKWAVEQLREEVASSATFDMSECFDACVSGPGLLVLLDGLDEVSSASYPDVSRAVNLLSRWLERNSPSSAVILTMRTQFHEQVHLDFAETFPPAYFVRRFTPNDIYQFLARWPFPEARREESSATIYGTLSDRPSLREMCASPLVLAMYVVAHDKMLDDASALPETRTDFYDQILEELLIARRGRQLGGTTARRALRDQREAILGRLAWQNLKDRDATPNLLSWPAALKLVKKQVGLPSLEAADGYFMELSKETGLFTIGKSGETFQFIHLTFCEFMAAKEIANGVTDGWDELIGVQTAFSASPLTTTRLSEVIPFAAALLPRQARDGAIRRVAAIDQGPMLARCFLETQMYGHGAWGKFAAGELEALSAVDSDSWNEEWTNRLHLYMVTLANAERWTEVTKSPLASPVRTSDVYQRLVGGSQEKLARVFASFAAVDGAAALRLAESLGFDIVSHRPDLMVMACKEPPMLATAVSRYASSVGDRRISWAAILVDAALLYQNVADTLNRRRTNSDSGRSYWRADRISKTYAECLDVVADAIDRGGAYTDGLFPRLGILSSAKPPRNCLGRTVISGLSTVPVIAIGAVLLFVLIPHVPHASLWIKLPVFLVLLIMYAFSFSLLLYPTYRAEVYGRMVNLPPVSLRPKAANRVESVVIFLNLVPPLRRRFEPIYRYVLRRQLSVRAELSANRADVLSGRG